MYLICFRSLQKNTIWTAKNITEKSIASDIVIALHMAVSLPHWNFTIMWKILYHRRSVEWKFPHERLYHLLFFFNPKKCPTLNS